jgi:hypothetical protein
MRMPLDLSKIAIALSLTAIMLVFWYPIDRYFRDVYEAEMAEQAARLKPYFQMMSDSFAVGHTYSYVNVQNTGDGAAHNVRISVLFRPVNFSFPGMIISPDWQNYDWFSTEFIPAVSSKGYAGAHYPIGAYQLQSVIPTDAEWNYTNYEADVTISCDEIESVTRHFNHRQFQP